MRISREAAGGWVGGRWLRSDGLSSRGGTAMYSALRQGNLVRKVPPSANHRFDFAAPQSHIGQRAVVEPQDQADLAAPTLLIHQFACQLDGAMGEHGEPFRELTSGAAQQRIHDKVAIALHLAMQLIGRRQRWVPEDLP